MDYSTVVPDLFTRFPRLEALHRTQFEFMGDDAPPPYIVFRSILIPTLTEALATADLGKILPICAFLEDVAEAAQTDNDLRTLMKIEVGNYLAQAENEDRLTPWLGPATKRLCNYTPGLATQRRQLKAEKKPNTLSTGIKAAINRLRGK